MNHKQSRIIIGTAISAAVIAVAVDHTRQSLPDPEKQLASQQAVIIIEEGEDMPAESDGDCGKRAAVGRQPPPCSL